MPKSKYILNYLDKKKQIDMWLEVYKNMTNNYIYGSLLGLVGYFILSMGFIK